MKGMWPGNHDWVSGAGTWKVSVDEVQQGGRPEVWEQQDVETHRVTALAGDVGQTRYQKILLLEELGRASLGIHLGRIGVFGVLARQILRDRTDLLRCK